MTRIAQPIHVIGWIVALIALAWLSTTDPARQLDTSFANLISGERGGALDAWMLDLSQVMRPLYIAPATLVGAALLWLRFRRWALLLPASFAASIAVTYAMKWFLDRPRPAGDLSIVNLHDAAFPSAHVAGTTSAGMALIQLAMPVLRRTARRLLDWCIIVLIGAVALSRVWVGAHWLTDVIGGLFAGIVGLIIAMLLMRSIGRRTRY